MWTRCRPVRLFEVKGQRGVVDSTGAEGPVVPAGDPESLGVGALQHPFAVLRALEGAAVRRCRGDEVVQEEVEGEDGAGEAQNAQEQELEPREAANIVQDLLKPHDGS